MLTVEGIKPVLVMLTSAGAVDELTAPGAEVFEVAATTTMPITISTKIKM
jgi:hypothetical protein